MALLTSTLALVVAAHPATGQREGYSYLSYAGSEVSLLSKASDDSSAAVNTPVMAGDRIQTGSSSRAEVILADGNVVRIDGRTTVRFDRLAATYEADDDRDLVIIAKGSVSLETRSTAPRETSPRIDTDDATVTVPDRSVIRVDAGKRGTEVFVLSGHAEVAGRAGRAVVRAGESAYVAGDDPIEVDTASMPRDRFSRFVEERRERSTQLGSSRYVSDEYAYDYDQGDFEEYGSWTYVSSLDSYCWRPSVAAGWLPYSNGYWRWTPCGLTWVSYEPWGWLPFHFGSWSLDPAIGWCWLPGRHYAPAWVYWNYSHGWVGWCPIGYYGQYSHFFHWGRERFGKGGAYPHLAGRADLARIDRRGWSFVGADRFGTRFDPKDVVRGDKLSFKPGHVGVISTAPLRVDRGSQPTVTLAVQETLRRASGQVAASPSDGRGSRGGTPELNQGLTEILRREPNLSSAGREELKHAWVRTGNDPGFHPVSAETIAQGTRPAPVQGSSPHVMPRLDGGFRQTTEWRESSARPSPRGEGAWREPAPGTSREVHGDGNRNRPVETGRGAPLRSDDGWRSSLAPRSGVSPREPGVRRSGETRRFENPSRSAPAPRRVEPFRSHGSGDGLRNGSHSPAPAPRSAPPPSSHAPAPSHYSSPAPSHKGG